MAAPNSNVYETLTRRHGIKVVSAISVDDCSVAVGDVIGHDCVLAASRMNNAIVLFVSTVEKANEVVEKGLVHGGGFIPVLPLSTPTKRVTISNVPPFVKDDLLARELSRYGKLVSPIKKISIGTKGETDTVKHVVSFRRYAYMILKNYNTDLDFSLKFNFDNFDYTVFVSTGSMRCFGCGKPGHVIRACPGKGEIRPSETTSNSGPSKLKVLGADTQAAAAAVEVTVASTGEGKESEVGAQEAGVGPTSSETVNEFTENMEENESGKTASTDNENAIDEDIEVSDSVSVVEGLGEVNDQIVFKKPSKRKKKSL